MTHKHTYSIPSADDQNDARCIECGRLQPTTQLAKHTPGPWIAERDTARNAYAWKVTGASGVVRDIARLALVDSASQVEANAHLIAAAPAMYEALKQAIDELADYEAARNDPKSITRYRCEAALAQAEGVDHE